MTRILFICLGNICRSPLAEAAFRVAVEQAGIEVDIDSAGTGGWHKGDAPDPRAIAEAKKRGVDIAHYKARQVSQSDFTDFDLIVAMDAQNLRDLRSITPPSATARLSLMLDAVPGRAGQSVADPYYGNASDFARTWEEVSLAASHLVAAGKKEGWWSLAGSNR